jgi:hypothetical protein
MEISEVPDEVVRDLCVKTPANHMPVTFIVPDELTDGERSVVPQLWLEALARPGRGGMGLMLDEWERVLPGRLPKVTTRMRAAGTDLILGRQLGVRASADLLADWTFRRPRILPLDRYTAKAHRCRTGPPSTATR